MKADDVKKLQQKKYREELRHFLVEGEHLILELIKASATQAHLKQAQLFITEQYQDWVNAHNSINLKVTVVGNKAMAQMSDTKSPQGIIAAAPFTPVNNVKTRRAIYLHEVQDPGNLGTILRTLGWFGDFRLLLSANSVDPYNPKVVRSSMGAIFHVPFELDVELADVAQRFPRIASLDMNGKKLSDASFKEFDCYVFGNEARGVPRDALTALNAQPFSIAGAGIIESLNLASAVNMCVYELCR